MVISSPSPTSSPTCTRIPVADIIFILDSSQTMIPFFSNLTSFVANYVTKLSLSPEQTRVGYVEYAGVYTGHTDFYGNPYITIGKYLNVDDPAASNITDFLIKINNLTAIAGNKITNAAFDFVRENMFTPDNYRNDSRRIVVLLTGGNPTDDFGVQTVTARTDTETASINLQTEDGVYLVVVPFLGYPLSYNTDFHANRIYGATFDDLDNLIYEDFLCNLFTESPTETPTAYPTRMLK